MIKRLILKLLPDVSARIVYLVFRLLVGCETILHFSYFAGIWRDGNRLSSKRPIRGKRDIFTTLEDLAHVIYAGTEHV